MKWIQGYKETNKFGYELLVKLLDGIQGINAECNKKSEELQDIERQMKNKLTKMHRKC